MASNGNDQHASQYNQQWSTVPGPAGDDKNLRPPKGDTESRVLNILNREKKEAFKLPVVDSKLSADAKEFVPGYQYIDKSASLSVVAAEFYPKGTEYYDYSYPQNADLDSNYLVEGIGNMTLQGYDAESVPPQFESTGDPVLDKFNHTLYVLNSRPGNMEEYLRPISELIKRKGGSIDVNNIVESLFEQSIQEVNFRYTGARICQYFCTNLKDTPQFTGFHKLLMQRCQRDYEKRDELLNGSQENQERLRGLTMFMAEIFLNVEIEQPDGSVQRMHFLPRTLMDLATSVLSKPDDPNIKCVCQLLKLSGALIEDIAKNVPEQCRKFEEMFSSLQSLKDNPNLSMDANLRISSVIGLKETNWNRQVPSPPKKAAEFAGDVNNFQGQEPVFFNQHGKVCSRQEANFPDEEDYDDFHVLNEEEEAAFELFEAEQKKFFGGYSNESYSDDPGYNSYNFGDYAGDGGEMGEELEAAYEEFLQFQQQQQQQQLQQHDRQHNQYHQQQQQPQGTTPNFTPYRPPPVPQPFYTYGPQHPPPGQHYQMFPQQDGQYPGHMPPGVDLQQQQMNQMNLQPQVQYQHYQQPSHHQQQQYPPHNYQKH